MREKPTTADVQVSDHGTIVMITPMSEEAEAWVEENLNLEPWQWLGGSCACDSRFAAGIIEVMRRDGLRIEGWDEARTPRQLLAAAYHRNGVAGEGFRVALFQDEDGSRKLGVLFEGRGQCAILDLALLGEGNIRAGENSWRVDEYESWLRPAVEVELEREYGELVKREEAEAAKG